MEIEDLELLRKELKQMWGDNDETAEIRMQYATNYLKKYTNKDIEDED